MKIIVQRSREDALKEEKKDATNVIFRREGGFVVLFKADCWLERCHVGTVFKELCLKNSYAEE